jgi:hypothetical protein
MPSTYAWPERRRRWVYVTQGSEYHCRDGICVAVFGRGTLGFRLRHPAIGRIPLVSTDHEGVRRIIFGAGTSGSLPLVVITSSVITIERPSREALALYEPLLDKSFGWARRP